jgi:hypothetical protein
VTTDLIILRLDTRKEAFHVVCWWLTQNGVREQHIFTLYAELAQLVM